MKKHTLPDPHPTEELGNVDINEKLNRLQAEEIGGDNEQDDEDSVNGIKGNNSESSSDDEMESESGNSSDDDDDDVHEEELGLNVDEYELGQTFDEESVENQKNIDVEKAVLTVPNRNVLELSSSLEDAAPGEEIIQPMNELLEHEGDELKKKKGKEIDQVGNDDVEEEGEECEYTEDMYPMDCEEFHEYWLWKRSENLKKKKDDNKIEQVNEVIQEEEGEDSGEKEMADIGGAGNERFEENERLKKLKRKGKEIVKHQFGNDIEEEGDKFDEIENLKKKKTDKGVDQVSEVNEEEGIGGAGDETSEEYELFKDLKRIKRNKIQKLKFGDEETEVEYSDEEGMDIDCDFLHAYGEYKYYEYLDEQKKKTDKGIDQVNQVIEEEGEDSSDDEEVAPNGGVGPAGKGNEK